MHYLFNILYLPAQVLDGLLLCAAKFPSLRPKSDFVVKIKLIFAISLSSFINILLSCTTALSTRALSTLFFEGSQQSLIGLM